MHKELLLRLRELKLSRALLTDSEVKACMISIYRDYLNLFPTDQCSRLYQTNSYVFGKPFIPNHKAFSVYGLEKCDFAGIITHSKTLKFGNYPFKSLELPLNNSITEVSETPTSFKYDKRPSNILFSIIDKNRIDYGVHINLLKSLGIEDYYERIKMYNKIKILWNIEYFSNTDISFMVPYQNNSVFGTAIDIRDKSTLKPLSNTLYDRISYLDDKISLFDLENSPQERILFSKFLNFAFEKLDHNILLRDGYWDSHNTSSDFEWSDMLDLL